MAVISLSSFNTEIDEFEKNMLSKSSDPSMIISEKTEDYIGEFKKELINRIKKNKKIKIEAGGLVIEKLVAELLNLENCISVEKLSKQAIKGKGDIDIQAEKIDFTGIATNIYCQIKHHDNFTGRKAIDQLIQARKEHSLSGIFMVITSAEIENIDQEYAENNDIVCMGGEGLVDWIYNNLDGLQEETMEKLGIAKLPVFFN